MSRLDFPLTVTAGSGRHQVAATAVALGDDLLVWLAGGTRPHVGALALTAVRPSRTDESRPSFTPALLTLPGHKEDRLALEGAQRLTTATGRTVVLVAGLHIDDATPEDIERLVTNAGLALDGLADALGED